MQSKRDPSDPAMRIGDLNALAEAFDRCIEMYDKRTDAGVSDSGQCGMTRYDFPVTLSGAPRVSKPLSQRDFLSGILTLRSASK